jgi:hypothetical protein
VRAGRVLTPVRRAASKDQVWYDSNACSTIGEGENCGGGLGDLRAAAVALAATDLAALSPAAVADQVVELRRLIDGLEGTWSRAEVSGGRIVIRAPDRAVTGETMWGAFSGLTRCDGLPATPRSSRVVVDPAGQPLDVGRRTRVVPSGIRTALTVRDRGCAYPGCDRGPQWTDAHHIRHWADGGSTSLDDLVLLCRHHHRAVHEGRTSLPHAPPQAA